MPLGERPRSEAALFRVIVSDGGYTSQSTSEGMSRVPTRMLQAFIVSPNGPASYASEQQVMLVGEGYHVENGNLGD